MSAPIAFPPNLEVPLNSPNTPWQPEKVQALIEKMKLLGRLATPHVQIVHRPPSPVPVSESMAPRDCFSSSSPQVSPPPKIFNEYEVRKVPRPVGASEAVELLRARLSMNGFYYTFRE